MAQLVLATSWTEDVMTGLQMGGIACLAYMLLSLYFAFAKPGWAWDSAKIKALRKSFGETGTTAFVAVWGSAFGAFGVFLLLS